MKKLLFILATALLLTACMNKYYDQFGGFPMESQYIVMNSGSPDIKLLVTYRFPYQEDRPDTVMLNMSVNVILAKADMDWVMVDKITVAAADESYFMTVQRPAVFLPNSRFPVIRTYTDPETSESFTPSDQPSLFVLDRNTAEYEISLHYRTYEDAEVIEHAVRSRAINVRNIKRKNPLL